MQIGKRLHRLLLLGPRGSGKPVDRETWESQFADGYWDHLAGIDEAVRYAALVAFVNALHDSPDVLDVGCGAGELLRSLERAHINSYLGTDTSAHAIDLAKSRFPSARLEVADFEQWTTSDKFDIIIFNESLYYAARPVETLARYRDFLNEGGFFLISIYRTGQRVFIWRALHKRFDVHSAISIENQNKKIWDIEVLRP